MFDRLKKSIQQLISDRHDCWKQRQAPVPPAPSSTSPPSTKTGASKPPASLTSLPAPSSPLPLTALPVSALRQQLVASEAVEETVSHNEEYLRITPAGPENLCAGEERSFTPDGLTSRSTTGLLRMADGRYGRAEQLAGGGECAVCHGVTNTVETCVVCRRPLCRLCYREFNGRLYCPEHHQAARFEEDAWSPSGGEKS